MQTREWLLTAAVIIVPLIIAVAVTLWSIEQARYRPKKRRPARGESGVGRREVDEARASDGAANGGAV